MHSPPDPRLLNRAQADRVLASHGLDGLVAARPAHVYHLSDWSGAREPGAALPASFAVLPRREADPGALVLDAARLRRLAAEGGTWLPNVVAYGPPEELPSVPRAGADAQEGAWLEFEARHAAASPAALPALVRAIEAAGLARATVGIDDLRVERWLRAAGMTEATFVHAPGAFAELRRVKSAHELELLRTAARLVERACLEAAAQIHDGVEWIEVENHFVAELAWRGGREGRLAGGDARPYPRVVRGQPTTLDARGRYRHYLGEIGRTVFVGEPGTELLRRNAAMQLGFRAACESIRPGVTYRALAERCVGAIRAHGFAEFTTAIPHGLGLDPRDDPATMTLAGVDAGDPALEPDMVIAVALPYVETGWGSLYLADVLRITRDGCEPFTSLETDLLLAP
jgi:Xaa-Pro aminopeptidase